MLFFVTSLHSTPHISISACDSGCTADLMLDMDFLDQAIAQYNESALHYIPYRYLDHVGNLTATFRVC